MKEINEIQKSINQIGMEGVVRYLPKGMKLHPCDIHGYFLSHYRTKNPTCPLCTVHTGEGNGTTASQVEQEIDNREHMQYFSVPLVVNI